jgi:hypothetical protein
MKLLELWQNKRKKIRMFEILTYKVRNEIYWGYKVRNHFLTELNHSDQTLAVTKDI